MRLRVCRKAEEHTRQAALLAQNLAQAELARRQAAAIRTMLRQGIERGGYRSPLAVLGRLRRFCSVAGTNPGPRRHLVSDLLDWLVHSRPSRASFSSSSQSSRTASSSRSRNSFQIRWSPSQLYFRYASSPRTSRGALR